MITIEASNWNTRTFQEIGRGGEAVIYKMADCTVAKVFLEPSDSQYASDATQQKAAAKRIEEMQKKLLEIPDGLPSNVVTPTGLLVDAQEKVFGYTMPFISNGRNLAEVKRGRKRPDQAKDILLQLYDAISALHEKEIVVGDLNYNNILVCPEYKLYLIDTDSMQFGSYECATFVQRFTPPEFLEATESAIDLAATRTTLTDWYAFSVIAMLLFANTDPYGGVVNLPLWQRIRERVTVFDSRVTYPETAVPFQEVPRPLLENFFEVFVKGERFVPERSAIESI